VQVHNAPGAKLSPGQVATWATAKEDEVEAFGFKWIWSGRSSKHFPFDWSDQTRPELTVRRGGGRCLVLG
jgi:hypothetical protein